MKLKSLNLIFAFLFIFSAFIFAGDKDIDEAEGERVEEMLKEFLKRYNKTKSEERKIALINDISAEDHPLVTETLLKLLKEERKREVKLAFVNILGYMESDQKEIVKTLGSMLKRERKDEGLMKALIWSLVNTGCDDAAYYLGKKYESLRNNPKMKKELARAMGKLGSPIAVKYLAKVKNSRDLSENKQLADTIIFALGNIRCKKSVDALFELYNIAPLIVTSRHGWALRAALKKLTGEDFERNFREWKEWWKKNKDKIEIKREDDEEETRMRKKKAIKRARALRFKNQKKKSAFDEEEDEDIVKKKIEKTKKKKKGDKLDDEWLDDFFNN